MINLMGRMAFYVFAATALLSVAAPTANAQTKTLQGEARATVLTLTAEGEVRVPSDQASLSFGVTTDSDTAASAIRLNREQMTKVLAALKTQGVPDTDIMTSGLSLNPRRGGGFSSGDAVKGYTAVNTVTVRFADPTKAGTGLDAVVDAGVNQIRALNFSLKDPARFQEEATRLAVKNLAAKADLFAQAAGKKVTRMTLLSDGTVVNESAGDDDTMVVVTGYRASTPVMVGERVIKVTVKGQFEIE